MAFQCGADQIEWRRFLKRMIELRNKNAAMSVRNRNQRPLGSLSPRGIEWNETD
jgi:hypothetical protein